MKTFKQYILEYNLEYPNIPIPIHYSNKILVEEIYIPEHNIIHLDNHLKSIYPITDINHINEIKKYSCGSFDLNKQLLEYHKRKINPPRIIKGTNYDWFGSKGKDKFPYEGYTKIPVEHDLHHLDNLTNTRIKEPLTVYSGIRFNPEEVMDSRKIIHVPSYYSSTIDPKITKEFSEGSDGINRVIKLHLGSDNKGIYIDKHHTFQNGEYKEFLLPRHI